MKPRNLFFALLILLLGNLWAATEMIVLPIHSQDLTETTLATLNGLLRQEIHQAGNVHLVDENAVSDALEGESCSDASCALQVGKYLRADQVVICTINTLGAKMIVQYMLVDIFQQELILIDNTTVQSIEELDIVFERIALSVMAVRPYNETVQVGNITEKEDERYFLRREARKYSGLSFGYLYPTRGYDGDDESFTIDYRYGFEMENITAGMQMAIRQGFAVNIYSDYLLTKTDFCPYIGGAFGFHWVTHDDDLVHYVNGQPVEKDGRKDGFELILQSGIRGFRTYNFQVLFNLDYSITFNDYDDEALVFTVGLLW